MSTISYNFTGERYVVTGASSGMGRQVTIELAQSGATVLALGRDKLRLQAVQDEDKEHIIPASLDVCDDGALEQVIENFVQQYGKLNGGVHAAGISDATPFRAYNRETVHHIMDVSFWAGMSLLQFITRSKYGEPGTSTVLFSSIAACSPAKGMFAYSAAKAAIDAAIRAIAKEICQKHHRVNTVLPGWVSTPMTEQLSETNDVAKVLSSHLLGSGYPEDVSGMVLFLLSSASRWITGSNIVVDGGGSLI